MNVRVVVESLSSGVQDAGEVDGGAEVLRMGRDRGERLSRGGEEQALYRAATYGLVPRGTRIAEDGRRNAWRAYTGKPYCGFESRSIRHPVCLSRELSG